MICCAAFCASDTIGEAVQSPTSAGSVALLDTPIVRVPKTNRAPAIDGVMEEGEWEDATGVSGFWYGTPSGFEHLAPIETQLESYVMYDDENLYVAYTSPVYPEGSWLKARSRFPRVFGHPLYGMQWDDHIEFEIRPYHDNALGFQMGLFKTSVNPIGVMDDAFWSIRGGWDRSHPSLGTVRSTVTRTRWVLEMAFPFEYFSYGPYAGKDENGEPIVQVPPPDGTAYRTWFARSIGGGYPFFNAWDAHMWNTTKTKLIFDSKAVSFQINKLGPIMEDMIDVRLTVKNHNNRSEAVRLGFFVENVDGLIYSSYEDSELKDGLLELIPGEVRTVRLRKAFPGISQIGNVLWFDVRSAGRPAKPIYQSRLTKFHSQDLRFPPDPDDKRFGYGGHTFKQEYIDIIKSLRPPRKDFEVSSNFWTYNNTLATYIDRGAVGASEKAQAAEEARIAVLDTTTEEEVAHNTVSFTGSFAASKFQLPELQYNRDYRVSVLLFDNNKRIVGEDNSFRFNRWGMPNWMFEEPTPRERAHGATHTPVEEWFNNKVGLNDVVWEPFTPIEDTKDGFETLNHVYSLGASGLPTQLVIKPSERKLPLELRHDGAEPTTADLLKIGCGAQLRNPMRLEAVIDGERVSAEIVQPAKLIRDWKSEHEYKSQLKLGAVTVDLTVQYDCDGSMHATLEYGADDKTLVDSLELLMDVAGPVDMAVHAMKAGGMTGADNWECSLPNDEGIVWDSAAVEPQELFYGHFVPFFFFGSGDRGFTWYAGNDRDWELDRHGSSMLLERNARKDVTWRIFFVNHPSEIQDTQTIRFSILVHPAKPMPEDYRMIAWHYEGEAMRGYGHEPPDLSEDFLKKDWYWAARAPKDIPWEEAKNWRKEKPPWNRYGRWRNASHEVPYGSGRFPHRISPALDQIFEDKTAYLLGRQIEIGRRHGWWWDEYWPSGFAQSLNFAADYAYLRDPEKVEKDELPYQPGWTTQNMRNTQKRLARVAQQSNVPNRDYHWANNQATTYESFVWDARLIEECGSDHRSFEVDVMAQFPMSVYRYMCHSFTGLPTRVSPRDSWPDGPMYWPGDDKRMDRQYIGLALAHDIGVTPFGHGRICHIEQATRLFRTLNEFGFFEDDVECIPYWRNQDIVRYGKGRQRYAPVIDLTFSEPDEQVYVTVYRRPVEINGRKGYKAMLVVLNGFMREVDHTLHILRPERVFGGHNILKRSEALAQLDDECPGAEALLAQWLKTEANDVPVLLDMETGEVVELSDAEGGEHYGSVYVPWHNYRLLYGYFLAE